MNVRNVFLMSMIFCAAPVVCAVSEPNLTKQEQEIIKKWVQEINMQKQHPCVQQVIKFLISSSKDRLSAVLGKMSLGRSKLEFNNEMIVDSQVFGAKLLKEYEQFVNKLLKDSRITEQQRKGIVEQILQEKMIKMLHFPLNKIITAEEYAACSFGETLREVNIATMKKMIAIYSFILECL